MTSFISRKHYRDRVCWMQGIKNMYVLTYVHRKGEKIIMTIMKKDEFVTAISEKTGFTKTDVRTFLIALQEVTVDGLRADKTVPVMKGMTLSRIFKNPRPTRNPQTGETMMTKAKYVPKCKFGKFLKESVE